MKKDEHYYRAITLKLYCSAKKKRQLKALIEVYRAAVNFYLAYLMENPKAKLNKETLAKLTKTKLTERYKSNALKQSLEIIKSLKEQDKNGKSHYNLLKEKNKLPIFRGYPILDAKFIDIQQGENSFNTWIYLATLSKGNKIYLPTKTTKVLKRWLQEGHLVQGGELHENKIIVWVKIKEQEYKTEGIELGLDLGMRKLFTTSDGKQYGTRISELIDKIRSKKKGSLAYKRAIKERNNYIDETINQLPWAQLKTLCYENLTNITKGKKGYRKYKGFRRKQHYWVFRKVLSRLIEKCQENRVRPVYVNPKDTSRTCPMCNHCAKANRVNEEFRCLACSYHQDADYVGALNILRKGLDWLRSLESLSYAKSYN